MFLKHSWLTRALHGQRDQSKVPVKPEVELKSSAKREPRLGEPLHLQDLGSFGVLSRFAVTNLIISLHI